MITVPRLDQLAFETIDLATIPPPTGTGGPAPTTGMGGMLNFPLPDGGMLYRDFGFVPTVASLGAPSLAKAAKGHWDGYTGSMANTLQAAVHPLVRQWAPDAVMVAASGHGDGRGFNTTTDRNPGSWGFAFRSPSQDEALLFAVTPDQTKLLRLTFKPPITMPLAALPHLDGMVIDSDQAMTTIMAAIRRPDAVAQDPRASLVPIMPVPPPFAWFNRIGGGMPILADQQTQMARNECRGDCAPYDEIDTGSRWQMALHEEALTDGTKRLLWYALLQPGARDGTVSEIKGGVAKVDAKTGVLLKLDRPIRTNLTAYRKSLLPTPVPIPPTAIPTPTGTPMPAPTPTPTPTP
ncbi:MAG: hypothetical protein H7338_08070 [Candidatus Sericytochromatia bacterium]|nr:hypothetical protein [Candidatus Sericytochromatia bacterium]